MYLFLCQHIISNAYDMSLLMVFLMVLLFFSDEDDDDNGKDVMKARKKRQHFTEYNFFIQLKNARRLHFND